MYEEKNFAEHDNKQDQTAVTSHPTASKEKDTEFGEELGSSEEFRSAFKNPITGEERLY
ncbi:hypothetical protein [Paenibacillus chibensis]|uniref:hypothetical protein n=1 Tax=Paenibacillus chibensis TaxID=59846 RepID=UPI0013E29673|nr:hypothetical protein [Paenibacillus chibensis]MEC0372304.1 hypothetical protein [Paenibacillus chibensis]